MMSNATADGARYRDVPWIDADGIVEEMRELSGTLFLLQRAGSSEDGDVHGALGTTARSATEIANRLEALTRTEGDA